MLTVKFMIFIVVLFIMLYAIVDRICRCVEHRKAIEEAKELIQKIKESMDNKDIDVDKFIL